MNKIIILLLLAILTFSCAPAPTPITIVVVVTATPQPVTVTSTSTASSTPTITLTPTITPTDTPTLIPAKKTATAISEWKTKVAPYQQVKSLGVYYESYLRQPVMVTGEVLIIHDTHHITVFEGGGGNKIAVSLDEPIRDVYEGDLVTVYGIVDGKYDTSAWSNYMNTVVLVNSFYVKK